MRLVLTDRDQPHARRGGRRQPCVEIAGERRRQWDARGGADDGKRNRQRECLAARLADGRYALWMDVPPRLQETCSHRASRLARRRTWPERRNLDVDGSNIGPSSTG